MSYLVYEQKTGSDGKVHDQLVVDNAAAPNSPDAQRDKLAHQVMKTELEDIISTCKEIGSTNGHGGNQGASGSNGLGATGPADSSAIEAAKKAVQAAQEAVDKDKAKVATAGSAYNAAEKQYQDAVKALDDLKTKLSAAESTLNDLKNELSKCHRYISHWVGRAHIEKPNPAYSDLQNKINAQQGVVNGLQSQVNAQAGTVSALQAAANLAENQYQTAENKLTTDEATLKSATDKLEALERAGPSAHKKADMHDIIWNHNVFWALLHVAMAGNSSVFNVLTSALGKIAKEMSSNQGITQIITNINNDLKELINFPKNPTVADRAHETMLIQDMQKQLLKLYYVVNPNASATTPLQKEMKKSVKGLGAGLSSDLKSEASQLFSDYKNEFNKDTGGDDQDDPTGLGRMLKQMGGQELPSGGGRYDSFDKFLNNMVNRDGKGAPSASTNAIYSHTSGLITSLNTAGSQFMAQQNLQTKQIDEIEKLWTSGISTDKSAIQTVTGNIAN